MTLTYIIRIIIKKELQATVNKEYIYRDIILNRKNIFGLKLAQHQHD